MLGGNSVEREVSLVSGKECSIALRRKGYKVSTLDPKTDFLEKLLALNPDVIFNALHGSWGEDGTLQGVLETLKIPYSHSGVTASSLAMNKHLAKMIFKQTGLPVSKHKLLTEIRDRQSIPFSYPYVVKPNKGGSSVGVYIMESDQDWSRLEKKDLFSQELLIEPFIPGRELTVTVLNGEALTVTDIRSKSWYDYQAKYEQGASEHIFPAILPEEITEYCLSCASNAHKILGCKGVSRVDFRWDECQGKKGLFILELNTQPGMTPTSLVPEQAQYAGVPFDDLCSWLVEDASCDR